MKKADIKEFLDEKVIQYNRKELFMETDPIRLPHSFSKKEDIEIISLLVSTIAWGNRKSILKSGENLLEIMGQNPHEFIQNYESKFIESSNFVHRTFNIADLDFFFHGLKKAYETGGLESKFYSKQQGTSFKIANFRKFMFETNHEKRSEKHISDPMNNSAAKRLNMFLRWMVRKDAAGVDFGIWESISSSELMLPLDVHTANMSRKLEILTRTQNDGKALEEIMLTLRKFDSNDPVKYDFALFGLGAFEGF